MPNPVALMDITSAREASDTPPRATDCQQSSRFSNQKTEVADAVAPVPSQLSPFMTFTKRRRLEYEADDLVITKTVTKAPKLEAPPTYAELIEENKKLKKEIHQLRLVNHKIASADKVIFRFVTSASIMETAVDVRYNELRKGLNTMSQAVNKVQDQLAEMVNFSNATTDVVCRITQSAGEDADLDLNKAEEGRIRRLYENAKPGKEVAEVIHEKLSFTPKTRGRPRKFT